KGIYYHDNGLKLLEDPVDFNQVHFKAKCCRPGGIKVEQALVDPTLQIDPNRAHIADDLVGGLFKGEERTFLPTGAGSVNKMSRQAGFSRAGRSGHQNAAAPI